jgi:hypothetical protein
MEDWERGVRGAVREQQKEKRAAWEHFRRICRVWPIVAITIVSFATFAFLTFDPALAALCTAGVFFAAVLIARRFG